MFLSGVNQRKIGIEIQLPPFYPLPASLLNSTQLSFPGASFWSMGLTTGRKARIGGECLRSRVGCPGARPGVPNVHAQVCGMGPEGGDGACPGAWNEGTRPAGGTVAPPRVQLG